MEVHLSHPEFKLTEEMIDDTLIAIASLEKAASLARKREYNDIANSSQALADTFKKILEEAGANLVT